MGIYRYDCALISLLMINSLSNMAYALIAPFLPMELIKKDIPQYMFGYIFCIYSVAVILCSPLIGILLTKIKRRSFVQFGIFMMSMAMFIFAATAYIENIHLFLTVCFITRFIQGFASSSI